MNEKKLVAGKRGEPVTSYLRYNTLKKFKDVGERLSIPKGVVGAAALAYFANLGKKQQREIVETYLG